MTKRLPLYYLSSPYTHELQSVMHDRYVATVRAAAGLSKPGVLVFSPIVHSVPMVTIADMGHLYKDWQDTDRAWVERCDAVLVLILDGWQKSAGINDEIPYAMALGKPIYGVTPPASYPWAQKVYTLFKFYDGYLDGLFGEKAKEFKAMLQEAQTDESSSFDSSSQW